MNRRAQIYGDKTTELGTLRSVLIATGGQAKIEELYRLLNAEQAARFLGLSESQVRHMTCRNELPCVQLSANRVGYQLIELIDWLRIRKRPSAVW
jgi:predicted DNA-binding transcriptional regulator AlpA